MQHGIILLRLHAVFAVVDAEIQRQEQFFHLAEIDPVLSVDALFDEQMDPVLTGRARMVVFRRRVAGEGDLALPGIQAHALPRIGEVQPAPFQRFFFPAVLHQVAGRPFRDRPRLLVAAAIPGKMIEHLMGAHFGADPLQTDLVRKIDVRQYAFHVDVFSFFK